MSEPNTSLATSIFINGTDWCLNLTAARRSAITEAVNQSKTLYIDEWNKCIQREPKMRTYRVFKSNFEKETYLSISNIKQRNAMSRFRISAHRLAIEQGRYKRSPIPVDQRYCPHCPVQTVEDEYHFLMEYTKYECKRKIMMTRIEILCNNFKHLPPRDKFIYFWCRQREISVKP